MTLSNKISWSDMTQKQWRINLQALLLKSDVALDRALLVIYQRQPVIERVSEEAIVHDGIGFNKYDAPILNDIAKCLEYNGHITDYQRSIVRKKLPKYWKQLMRISKEKHGW